MKENKENENNSPNFSEESVTTKVNLSQTAEGINITEKVPRVLLEVLVYGTAGKENKKDQMHMQRFLDCLQKQINESKKAHMIRGLWVADNGEAVSDDKIKWLIENCNCKYYILIDDNYVIPPTFIKDALKKIKALEAGIKDAKDFGIVVKKNVQLDTEFSTNLSVVK